MSLLYFGIHKYGTAGSQINGVLCKKGGLCKILHAVIERTRKGLNKGSAAGGAGFVKLNTVHGVILNADAFHILSTDIQDTIHLRIEELSGIVMGHRLHLTLVQHQGSFNQRFPVAGRAGTGNSGIFRKKAVNIPNGPKGSL